MNNTIVVDDFVAPKCHAQIKVLYSDDDMLVIEKPSGLLSLSGKNPLNYDCVHYRIVKDFPNAQLCHRLDLGTSGLILIGLNKEAIKRINKQFELRTIKKTYEAVLMGNVIADEGTLEYPIAKGEFPLQIINEQTGKNAQSHFIVTKRYKNNKCNNDVTEVLFTPKTGRTHQLRVHAQAFGHSILGDDLYGDSKCQSAANRLMLNAYSIEFVHPINLTPMVFHASTILS